MRRPYALALAAVLVAVGWGGCGPKGGGTRPAEVGAADPASLSDEALARLRATAEGLAESPDRAAARHALATAFVESLLAFRVAHRPELGPPLQRLLHEPAGPIDPGTEDLLAAKARRAALDWLPAGDGLVTIAGATAHPRPPPDVAAAVAGAMREASPAGGAARLFVFAHAREAVALAGASSVSHARIAAEAGAVFPFPCPAVFARLGRASDEASREAALRSGCTAICPGSDCWKGLLATSGDAGWTSAAALVLAHAMGTARAIHAGSYAPGRTSAENAASADMKAVVDGFAAGVPAPLDFLARLPGVASSEWPVSLPGARGPTARVFAVRAASGWILGVRPLMKFGDGARLSFDAGTAGPPTAGVPEDRLGAELARLRVAAPGRPATTLGVALPAETRADALAAVLEAARTSDFDRAELLAAVLGGGIAAAATTPLGAPPVDVASVIVTETVVARREGTDVKIVDEGKPLGRAFGEGLKEVAVRFDVRTPVGRVLDVAEELSGTGANVWFLRASDEDVVDAREAAERKPLVFSGGYAGAKLKIVEVRIEKALRACPVAGKGTVAVRLVVSPVGVVMDASIAESTFEDDALAECWSTRLRKLALPAPSPAGLAEVEHSVTF